MIKYTTEEILDLVQRSRERLSADNSRELVVARELHLAREVYKEQNNKITKYVSREDGETGLASHLSLGPLAEEQDIGQEVVDNVIPAATTSSREITGISVQQVRASKGLKLTVTIQTAEDREQATYVDLTAELKRHSRLRELKRYDGDSFEFSEHYVQTIEEIKALTPKDGSRFAIGRLHVRGARGHWFADMMAVAQLDDTGDIVREVNLNINNREYQIKLTAEGMSPNQERNYYNSGMFGQLRMHRQAPRLETAQRKAFK